MLARDGFVLFGHDPRVAAWAKAARPLAEAIAGDPVQQTRHLRHAKTWFVGVDALPNTPDGEIGGVALAGPWQDHVPDLKLHRGQVSIIYPGYPAPDPDQSEAQHRYRRDRHAAHVDGLLPEGTERRRFAREYHAYILGLPLNPVAVAPTVVWPGSHHIMRRALAGAIGRAEIGTVDVTQAYHNARKEVFATGPPVPLIAQPGQAFVIHRLALHGTASWEGPPGPGRMVAFFRPEFEDPRDWLA